MTAKPSAFRDIVVLNAAAALVVAGKAKDLAEGAKLAASAIDTGAAPARRLTNWCVSPTLECNVQHSRQDQCLQARRNRRGQGRAIAVQTLRRTHAMQTPVRGFRGCDRCKNLQMGQIRAHCRDQEGEPVERPDPRRFRSPCPCSGLRGRGRRVSFGADRYARLFRGIRNFSKAARAACLLPVLRKDFMLDPYQVVRGAGLGGGLHPHHHGVRFR